ncbi:hypothetical protein [Nocardia camponoti]|nr:hypothetical protein [Nocardia camponoti]
MRWRDQDIIDSGFEWVAGGMRAEFPAQVSSFVPLGFAAYARLLHPLSCTDSAGDEVWLRWADAARALGADVHRQMQLVAILSRPSGQDLRTSPPERRVPAGSWESQIPELASILGRHTSTPDDCYFAFWEGNSAFDDIAPETPKLTIQGMRFFVVKGPVVNASSPFHGLSPTLWWPQDRAWLVATPDDFPCTYVGGDAKCIADISRSRIFEALPALPSDPVSAQSDTRNWIVDRPG